MTQFQHATFDATRHTSRAEAKKTFVGKRKQNRLTLVLLKVYQSVVRST